MASLIVSDFSIFMHNHAEAHEILSALLSKAQALSFILMKANFDECPEGIIEYFLWALTDILTESVNQNEIHLKELLRIIREKNL